MTFMCSNLASLPLVLLGLHSAPKDDQACSSAEAVYGPPLMLPGLFLGLQPSEKFLDRSILQSFSTSPSHHGLRRNPPRAARQSKTASSTRRPRRWCWGGTSVVELKMTFMSCHIAGFYIVWLFPVTFLFLHTYIYCIFYKIIVGFWLTSRLTIFFISVYLFLFILIFNYNPSCHSL